MTAPGRTPTASRQPRRRRTASIARSMAASASRSRSVASVAGVGVLGQARLDDLQVPVAQLAVDEVVQAEGGLGEVKAVHARLRVGLDRLQAREDPAILDGARLRPRPRRAA